MIRKADQVGPNMEQSSKGFVQVMGEFSWFVGESFGMGKTQTLHGTAIYADQLGWCLGSM